MALGTAALAGATVTGFVAVRANIDDATGPVATSDPGTDGTAGAVTDTDDGPAGAGRAPGDGTVAPRSDGQGRHHGQPDGPFAAPPSPNPVDATGALPALPRANGPSSAAPAAPSTGPTTSSRGS